MKINGRDPHERDEFSRVVAEGWGPAEISNGWIMTDELPSERGHRAPDPMWQKAMGCAALILAAGLATAAVILAVGFAVSR